MVSKAVDAFLNMGGTPPSGVVLMAVLPGGCQFDCPFCIVKQRDERRTVSRMMPEHFAGLVTALDRHTLLSGAAIVGDEPLQRSAWPYTQAFLAAAQSIHAPTAMISNGFELAAYASQLEQFSFNRIFISVDGVGARHDAIRRTEGAFAEISKGIALAAASPQLRWALTIATILLPGNIAHIGEIIAYAAAQPVRRVVLSPLVMSSQTQPLRVQRKSFEAAVKALPGLVDNARQYAVSLTLSDEFSLLEEWDAEIVASGIEIARPRGRMNLVQVDAEGRIETYDTIRAGQSTGLRLPEDLGDIDEVARRIVDLTMPGARAAA